MLKNIPQILSPELLKVLAEMGHGDTIVLADGNFPSANMGTNSTVIRADGHGVLDLLEAILRFFPLDPYVDKPAQVMAVASGDPVETPIWDRFAELLEASGEGSAASIEELERSAFYEASKSAYAIVASSESALYGNLILRKGVVNPS